ncbi:LysR family transcriptional regulator YeiE [Dissulfuribacter thermophilus]|uniref:LysR family transcriptional regulator YeiE n=1 Tax=Dissulfuribacter thermophilus TaxID=1156395 RepID=A0A1B9F335_9BACT|nr:LysR family transcriptional regulator [Dissulfuribacter thermophilus]OCC14330.1 LysR family transcriptional regulator YeiE [Dissulfuribacter thermophilus]
MAITLRQLEIFLAVAQTQHVTKASKRLFLTQSAISMAISELEHQFGTPLFDRLGRRLVLNDRGRLLLPHATEILRQVKNVETLLTETGGSIAGELKVSASTTIGNYLLPYLLGAFVNKYPNIVPTLQVGNTEQVEKGILSGDYDIGFIEGYSHHKEIETIPWLDDELVVIAGPRDPLCKKSELTKRDLEEAKWIVREQGSGTEEIFESEITKQIRQFNVLMRLGHTEAIKKAVESGLGIGCLSSLSVGREIEEGWLVRLPVPFLKLQRKLLIVLHRKKNRTALLNEFLSFCEQWKSGSS